MSLSFRARAARDSEPVPNLLHGKAQIVCEAHIRFGLDHVTDWASEPGPPGPLSQGPICYMVRPKLYAKLTYDLGSTM